MTSRQPRRLRRLVAATAASALTFAGLAIAPSAAHADHFDLERLAGANRFETAVEISQETFPGGSNTVLLSRHDLFPDALAGNSLAGIVDGGSPILLSFNSDVPDVTLAELDRLNATNVILLGGDAALDDSVANELTGLGYNVDRVGGIDRYETMNLIAHELPADQIYTSDEGTIAFVANGQNFPDALAAGPQSYNATIPMVLTRPEALHPQAQDALADLGIDHVVILGGNAAVSAATEAAIQGMGITTERAAGDTRYETAVELAEWTFAELGWSDEHVNVATGQDFPDALTGGPHAGEEASVIILTRPESVPPATQQYFEAHADTLLGGHIYGGQAAVSNAVEAALEAIVNGAEPTTNQSFAVAQDPEVTEFTSGTPGSADGTGGTRDVTVSGIDADEVDVALVPCYDDEIRDENGFITFLDQDEDDHFDLVNGAGETATGNAEIVSIDAEPVASTTYADNVDSADGTLSVRVRATDVDCARILVFADDDDDDRLDLDEANEPSEAFGVSGMMVWHFGEAPSGTDPHDYILFIDHADDFFVLEDGFLYNYDTEDVFGYDDVDVEDAITYAQFELASNINRSQDEIDMQSAFGYQPGGENRYALDHEKGGVPTDLTLTEAGDLDNDADQSDVTLTWDLDDPKGLISHFEVEIYTDADQTDCDSGALDTTDTTTGNTEQITVEDLGDGDYCAIVQSVTFADGGIESYDSEPLRFTVFTGEAPTIQSATLETDAVTEGLVDANDVWELVFSEEMDPTTVEDATFSLTDTDGDTFIVQCDTDDTNVDANNTEATCALGNGDDATVANDTLTITLDEDAIDRNAAGDDAVEYPVTITATDGIADLDDNAEVDVANSSDKQIG